MKSEHLSEFLSESHWESIIGLEVHAQLLTKSKFFSSASTAFGEEPNMQVNWLDAALPGTLPTVNREAVRMAVTFGLAIGAVVNRISRFARKNYFYPDLPKGYQISQHEHPIVGAGALDIMIENEVRRIGITRAHLEEDAGKSVHEGLHGMTGVDLNRAGIPLLEIVSEPDMRSAKEAVAYLKTVHTLVRYLNICDGNMQEGSFRCDANVSVRRRGEKRLGTRVEIKNMNSFRAVERAINLEIARQIDRLEQGQSIQQETRLYDADRHETRSMRSKESASDYRYFPDPDLLPLTLCEEEISAIQQALPELPKQIVERFQQAYQLSVYDAAVLTADPGLASYFEEVVRKSGADPKLACNWITTELLGLLNKENLSIQQSRVRADSLAQLLKRIQDKTLSGKMAKELFATLWQTKQEDVDQLIQQMGFVQIEDQSALMSIINQVIEQSPMQLEQYRAGKEKLFEYFVGQVMKVTKGQANPEELRALLKERLSC